MAKIVLCLSLWVILLPNIISAWFPGDGCCIQWSRDGTCCRNSIGQCCGDVGFGNDFGFRRHHRGPRREPDGRFDGRRGDFGKDRSDFGDSFGRDNGRSGSGFNSGDRFPNDREEFRNRPDSRQEGERFDGNDRHNSGENNRQGSGQFGGNNRKENGQSGGNNGQEGGKNNRQGGGKFGGNNHQEGNELGGNNRQAGEQSEGGSHQGSSNGQREGKGGHQGGSQGTQGN